MKAEAAKRHECGAVGLEGKLYLIGGRRSPPTQALDLATGEWQTVAAPPMEMHHMQPVAVGGRIYVIGAMTGGFPKEKPVPNVYVYDPKADVWTKGAEIPADRQRGAAGAVEHGGWIYLVAGIRDGHRGGFVPWLDRYHIETGRWERLPDAPRARDHFAAVVVGERIVAAGGRTSSQATGQTFQLTVAEVDVYDIGAGKWRTLPNAIPTPRAGTAAVAVNGLAVILGGESGEQASAHDEVEAVDPVTGVWQKWPELSRGRHGTGAAVIGGRLVIAAGSGNRGGGPELGSAETLKLISEGIERER